MLQGHFANLCEEALLIAPNAQPLRHLKGAQTLLEQDLGLKGPAEMKGKSTNHSILSGPVLREHTAQPINGVGSAPREAGINRREGIVQPIVPDEQFNVFRGDGLFGVRKQSELIDFTVQPRQIISGQLN